MDDWEPSYLSFALANQHLLTELPMTPNHRGPIYAAIQAARQRVLTPDERIRLDRLLDDFDVPNRGRK